MSQFIIKNAQKKRIQEIVVYFGLPEDIPIEIRYIILQFSHNLRIGLQFCYFTT